MIRVPSLPVKIYKRIDELETFSYNDLFDDDQIEEFLAESTLAASEDLYHSLQNPPKALKKKHNLDMSILKYLIRASTRPTPYGLYAGVGLGKFSDCNKILARDYYKDVKVDAHWISHMIHQIELQPEILQSLKVKFNPSCYVSGERIYNPYFTNHGEINSHSLDRIKESDIRYTNLVKLIKENAVDFTPYSLVVQLVQETYEGVPEEIMKRSLTDLIENEYLYTNLRLPAYNSDALSYVIGVLKRIPEAEYYVTSFTEIHNLMKEYKSSDQKVEQLENVCHRMSELYEVKNYCVVNKAIKFDSNYLNCEIKKKLEYFVETLSLVAVEHQGHSRISKFKESFAEEFGYGVEVNLLDIINPNGFDGLALLEWNIKEDKRERRIKEIIDNKIQLALMRGESEISLVRKDFENLPQSKEIEIPSTSFDINFYLSLDIDAAENQFILTVAPNGGAMKAGGMFQRFADAFDEEMMKQYNSIYAEEKDCAKENYLFVEIREAACTGRHENLVNQYKNYDYFLPIGCDGAHFPGSIELKDLSVGVSEEGKLYLYSEKLGNKCRIITDNMLNTTLNSPLLQLLKSISDEYESQPMGRLFALTGNRYIYTPRISLEHVIVSVKKWRLTVDELDMENLLKFESSFRILAKQYQIERYILVYENDNRLLLDCERNWAIELLYTTVKKLKILELSEIPEGIFEGQLVQDKKENYYFSEYTFSFIKKKKEKEEYENSNAREGNHLSFSMLETQHRKLLPGSDGWLYLKLYGYKGHQNIILTKEIPLLVEELNMEKFFFLRYHDEKPHLRVRFQFKKETMQSQLPVVFEWLKNLENKGLIGSAAIDTYKRENNRYGGSGLIEKAEQVFFADSLFVIRLLQLFDMENEDERTVVYMFGMLSMFCQLLGSTGEIFELLDNFDNRHMYRGEFHKKQKGYIKMMDLIINRQICDLDKQYETVKDVYLNREKVLAIYKDSLNDIELKKKENIVSSMVHMFCNRITGNRENESYYRILLRHCVQSKISKEFKSLT